MIKYQCIRENKYKFGERRAFMVLKKNIVLKNIVITCLVVTVLFVNTVKPCSASSDFTSDSIISLNQSNDFVINQEEATLYTGGYSIYLFTTDTSKKVTWKSSNIKVAKVSSSGEVSPVKKGTAIITATSDGKKSSCTITVKDPHINYTNLTLVPKQKKTLSLAGIYSDIKWNSANKSIATVDSQGQITAKKAGKTQITAYFNKKSYSCTVNVVKKATGDNTIIKWKDSLIESSVRNSELFRYSFTDDITLSDAKKIKSFSLFVVDDVTLEDLTYFVNLEKLEIVTGSIKGVSSLENLKNLEEVILIADKITGLNSLSNLTNIKHLNISCEQVTNIDFLKNLNNLETLDISDTQVSNINPLKNLSKLTELKLKNNKISDISVLKHLPNLIYLDLYNNNIINIESVSNLIQLETLVLEYNNIKDISSLDSLIMLVTLDLGDNKISDISVLENLINLNTLSLRNNRISNIESLKKLNKLFEVYLYGNDIIDKSPADHIPYVVWESFF